MTRIIGYTRGGEPWIPKFIQSIDMERCIGCGRCYKICGRDVLMPIEKPFEGEDEFGERPGKQGNVRCQTPELYRLRRLRTDLPKKMPLAPRFGLKILG